MKLQYKASLIMSAFGAVLLLLLSVGYGIHSHRVLEAAEQKRLLSISQDVALHVQLSLQEKIRIARTLASSPLIKEALIQSNAKYAALSEAQRRQEVDRLNQQWIQAPDVHDSFVQTYMTNPVAEYLEKQKAVIPEEYGELFLTDRYGVLVAATQKLTTLAHAPKYWWVAAYHNGAGRIFLDDRGYDTSVGGYVLGVVVPIMNDDEVIGILKCNVNIMGSLTDAIQPSIWNHVGGVQIVRSGGLIVAEQDVVPLSYSLDENSLQQLRAIENGTAESSPRAEGRLDSFSPVQVTLGSKQIGFGGHKQSIDHTKGNAGEAWYVVVSIDENVATRMASRTTRLIVWVGCMFTILTGFISLLFGRWVSRPIVKLSKVAQVLGAGQLEARAEISSGDEIGALAASFNDMANNLQSTMISREKLLVEVSQRKKAEEDKKKTISKLEQAIEEIETLQGILPICMYCKGIRDDEGSWTQLEEYILDHSQVQFSHGVCDKCQEKHFPDLQKTKS